MRKFLSALVASSMLVVAPVAIAHPVGPYISPAATPGILFTGTATVQKGSNPPFLCVVDITFSGPEDAGDGLASSHTHVHHLSAVATFSPGHPACPTISALPVPAGNILYNISTNKITFTDFFVNTVTFGDCAGDITGEVMSGGILLDDVVLPEVIPESGDCTVSVFLEGSAEFSGPHS